jgi:hypothetical protein
MRAVDDDTKVKLEVLYKLQQWGPLPESDVSRMLRQYFLVTDDFRAMAEEGLIDMEFVGDEYILKLAVVGRLFIEQAET